ncbi:MAG TPA: phosphotransferase family protein [Steroidobacteraceae bacterium]|nr:phosphotransferase family protein [Steroidobacteraceae bacterium]
MSATALHAASEGSNARSQIDVGRLESHLARHLGGFEGPLRVEKFPGGQSNPTFKLLTPSGAYAMRCKPGRAAELLPSAHAIEREFRVQSALAASAVPVAKMHHLCEDETVIGRAFYVMEFVEGRIFWDQTLAALSRAERGALYDEMNRVIAALHGVDYAALGLADYGKPGNYLARQIDRWTRQYRASQTETIEEMDRLIEWLPAHIPGEKNPPTSIVHGDFRIDNLIFHPTEPRVRAVIDWELSTLGHPLADFAYHAMSWRIPPERYRGIAGLDLVALGIPTESEYWARYLERTGLELSGSREFYLAYNMFRAAGILQGIAKRLHDGTAASAQAADLARSTRPMAELGWQFARQAQAPSSAAGRA